MSSLAAQLAQGASLNSSLLVDRSHRKPNESYLFTGRDADLHDLESIHALGTNGLMQLASVNPEIGQYESALFSDASKDTDRTLLSKQNIEELDRNIDALLSGLGQYLMEAPTGKVLEWLVRRFRINEFNLESILTLFLPYHESPHFAKMLTILRIKPNTLWDFLIPFQKAAQSVPRLALVTVMLKNSDLARFVTNLLPHALKSGHSHRTLLAFNAATIHDYLAHAKNLDDGTVAYILPALLEPLRKRIHAPKDAILGSYILLATLSHKCRFTADAVKAVIISMINSAKQVSTRQFINAAVAVCEAQDEIGSLSIKNISDVLNIAELAQEINVAAGWVGIEKFLNPMLNALTQSLESPNAVILLETIIIAPDPPKQTIYQLSRLLLVLAAEPSDAVVTARRLLQHVHQRYPAILHEAMDKTVQGHEQLQNSLDQLIVSLSMNQSYNEDTDKETADMLVAVTSADSKVRVIATRSLLSKLEAETLSDIEEESARSALLARTQDNDATVLDALYSKPSVVLPILVAQSTKYIMELSALLSSTKPKRPVLKAHLTFILTHFASLKKEIFYAILFPLMLYTKPRQHGVELVWDTLEQSGSGRSGYKLLNGCVDIWSASKAEGVEDVQEKMAAFNLKMSVKIAENIMSSNDFTVHVQELVQKLGDENSHVRLLACVIAKALLQRLSGWHQVDTALKIVQALDLESLSKVEELTSNVEELRERMDDARLGKSVVSKPSSKNTLYWMQLSVMTVAANVPPPQDAVVNWLAERATTNSSDNREYCYVSLMRTIYKTASSSTLVIMLNTLSVVFAAIQEDALTFLTGIWLTHLDEEDLAAMTLSQCVALLNAFKSTEVAVDFQTVLPALLVALQSSSLKIREYALQCLVLMSEGTQRKFERVYAYDSVYGEGATQLLYLSQDDLTKYLAALVAHKDHYLHDPGYVIVFHQEYLSQSKVDKRKAYDHKRSVISYLGSHINATPARAQYWLLKVISAVVDDTKASVLLPCVNQVMALEEGALQEALGQNVDDMVCLVVALFDPTSAKDLNNDKEGLWSTYCNVVAKLFKSTHLPAIRVAIQCLEDGLFKALITERQSDLCDTLLDLNTHSQDVHSTVTKLLATLVREPTLVLQLLQGLQPNPVDSPPATKRPRLTSETSKDTLPKLSVLAEVLASAALPGSLDIIIALVQTLNNVIQTSTASDVVDVVFIEQSLMSAVSNVAEHVLEVPNLSPSAVRLEVLVDLIRTADNPQTFQQALLLMATLARLSPESVLHNIMPVFTFMGSNVFHRDDTYSFIVVQKTIDNIVPVMVASLKTSHTSRMELLLGSRDFLRVFSDAANHIPRHRRTNFFVHLVNVLGPEDYLLPICLLLVEKVANRVVRQTPEEAKSTFALPISVLHHYDGALQNTVLSEMISESQRLTRRVTDSEDLEPTFMDDQLNEEHSTSVITAFKRRAQAVLSFVGYAVNAVSGSSTTSSENSVVALLVLMATFKSGQGADARVDDINKVARSSLNKTLRVLSALEYIKSTVQMLKSSEQMIQIGALDLLVERLPQVSDLVRTTATPNIITIVQCIKAVLIDHPGSAVSISAFRALKTVSASMSPGEESALGETVPLVLAALKGRKMAPHAVPALAPLALNLGPRIIPFFREIVGQCVAILQENLDDLSVDTTSVLHGLLSSIPTFWAAAEISQVVMLHITQRKKDQSLAPLVKALIKRAQDKVVIPTLMQMWTPAVQSAVSSETYDVFFDVVRRALRTSSKSVVQENVRALFSMFLEALDVVRIDGPFDGKAPVVAAFSELIVNINEHTFRPLFRRLYDWAFVGDTATASRKITFCHVFSALLDYFKALMAPYISFILQEFIDYWKKTSTSGIEDSALWSAVLTTVSKSMMHDDGLFWQDDKVRQVYGPMIAQIAVCTQQDEESKLLLQRALPSLVENATDDILLKSINVDILMHTRSEDVQTRLFALNCSKSIWLAHGGKLIGFVAETSTFIAECSEDENDMVCREAITLKTAVETVAGSISGL